MSTATRLAGARGSASAVNDWDGLHYWLIFSLSFPMHLAAACSLRLMPTYWRRSVPRKGLLVEAWTSAATTARIAFYG